MALRLSLLAAIVFALGCREAPAPTYAAPLPQVRTESVTTGSLILRETIWGEVATPPGREARLGSLESGYLADLRVAEGDPIRRGQILADLTAGPSRDQVGQARARLVAAQAQATLARAREARTAELLGQGASSSREAEQNRAAARSADAAVAGSRAALDAALRHLAHTEVRAPFDGRVLRLLESPGEAVAGAGAAILEVADTRTLELHATASAAQAERLRVGQEARLSFPTLAAHPPLAGRIVSISPSLNGATGTARVRLALGAASAPLKLGLYGRAELEVGRLTGVLWLPASAVEERPEAARPLARVVGKDGRIAWRLLTLGAREEGRFEVRSGVAAGERVVVAGGYGLPDGAAVEIAPEALAP